MLRYAIPLSLSALLFACNDDKTASDPSNGSDVTDNEIADPGDDGSGGNGTGDIEDGSTGGEMMPLANADIPCEDSDSAVLEFDGDGNLFAGCGDEEGLWIFDEDEDGGSGSFELISSFESANVYNFTSDEDGSFYAIGSSDVSYVSQLTVTGDDGEESVTAESSVSISISSSVEYVADSEADEDGDSGSSFLSISSDYETLIWSNGMLSYSSDDWEAENEWMGESYSNLMFSLTSWSEAWYGAGESEDGHPSIYAEAEAMLDAVSMTTLEWEDTEGYFSDIESSSEGLFAVGYDAGEDEGLALFCDDECDAESAWESLDLSGDASGDGSISGEITDVDFDDEGGTYGMIVGSLSGSASGSGEDGEGFAMFTTDGGLTWESVDEELSAMANGSIDGEGNFVLSDDEGNAWLGNVGDYTSQDMEEVD